jgi:hypothetical protein
MNDAMKELSPEVEGWIGEERYVIEGDFDVERGYVFTSCASVENGNPLFWDEKVANELTDGWIAPPSMISVWFRPHHWSPGRTEAAVPLQVHFDLKEALGLPEAVMTDNTITFGDPVRPGAQRCGRNQTEIIEGGAIGPSVRSAAAFSSQKSGLPFSTEAQEV